VSVPRRSFPWWVLIPVAVVLLVLFLPGGRSRNVARVNAANPDLQAAAQRAQAELPRFIQDLRAAKPGQRFAIKAGFDTSAGEEYLWVKDPTFDGKQFSGTLDQQPIALPKKRKGDKVQVPLADVYDWLIRENGQNWGGYTERVLTPR